VKKDKERTDSTRSDKKLAKRLTLGGGPRQKERKERTRTNSYKVNQLSGKGSIGTAININILSQGNPGGGRDGSGNLTSR